MRHSLHILTSSQKAVTPLSGPEVYIAMLCIICYVIVIGEAFFVPQDLNFKGIMGRFLAPFFTLLSNTTFFLRSTAP